jgi:exopolysaccharide biosynthesis WecB/TagA/CpsF family protein
MSAGTLAGQPERRGAPRLPERDILGVDVSPLTWDEAMGALARRIAEGRFTKVGFLNAHIANIAHSKEGFADVLGDFLVLPDGVGVDMAAKLLYGDPFPANLNGTDFVPAFLKAQVGPLKVGLLGATRRNAEDAVEALSRIAPQHEVVLIHDGFFTEAEEAAVLDRLKQVRPDVLLVAMGVPRQEFWIASRLSPAHCTMAFAVGALLDFLSGSVPRAPDWMRGLRLEWLFRLAIEPARLWRRYLVGNPLFLSRVLFQKLARRAGKA